MEEDLETWRRTHYSSQITQDLEGRDVTVFGMVLSIRRQKNIAFLIVKDKDGMIQVTAHADAVSQSVLKKLSMLRKYSYVGVKGKVKIMNKAPRGVEIIPHEIKILSEPYKLPPFSLLERESLVSLDKRLDLRAIDLRRPFNQSIFKIRHVAIQSIREFLSQNGYLEVNTPKIISSATEGGAALFPLLYYDKEAFLAQSPQLYKEQLIGAFEKVFEIGPIFRAEHFRTLRHLSETISVDVEEAFVSYQDVMDTLENLIFYVINRVSEECRSELEVLGHNLKKPTLPFKRYTYREILKILEDSGIAVQWGEDLPTLALQTLGDVIKDFYFITDWPTITKAFYIKPKKDKPELCEAFDLMFGSLEIASGGSRISSKDLLVKRLTESGLNPKLFEYHLKIFDYGIPPHAGFGLGFDRFMMVLTGRNNIREVVLYPRDPQRLVP